VEHAVAICEEKLRPATRFGSSDGVPTEEELWMGKYSFEDDGMIIVIDNPSSAVYAQQERNLRSTRPINDGIERFIKSKE